MQPPAMIESPSGGQDLRGNVARRSSFRHPQVSIPGAAGGGKGIIPDAEPTPNPVAAPAPTRGLTGLESVLSPSRVHMGVGQIIPNMRDAPPQSAGGTALGIGAIKEERYIPVALAKAQIEKMMQEMEKTKSRHADLLTRLEAQYRNLEAQSQSHYVSFIQELKAKAATRIEVYKKLLRETEKSHQVLAHEMREKIDSLNERLQEEAASKRLLMEEHRTEEEKLRADHTTALRGMERAYEAEHTRLISVHAAELQARKECLVALMAISGQIEDEQDYANKRQLDRRMSNLNHEIRGQAEKQYEELQRIKKELAARRLKSAVDVTILQRKVEKLLRDLEVQQESLRTATVQSVINELVMRVEGDMANQDNKMALFSSHESDLRLATVQAAIHDVVARVEGRVADQDHSKKLSCAMMMIEELEAKVLLKDKSILDLQQEVASSKEVLVVLEQSKADAEKMIEDLKAKMAAYEEAAAKMVAEGKKEGSLEISVEESQAKSSTSNPAGNGHQRRASLMAWPSDSRVNDLQRKIKTLEGQVEAAAVRSQQEEEKKRVSKSKVKAWMTEFEAREGHPPTNQDKTTVRELFVDYKATETSSKEAVDQLASLQQALETARKELEGLLATIPGAQQTPRVIMTDEVLQLQTKASTVEARVAELHSNNEEIEAARRSKKQEIKQWVTEFEAKEGRPPTNQDKEQVKELYLEFRRLENKSKADAEALAAAQNELDIVRQQLMEAKSSQPPQVSLPPPSQSPPGDMSLPSTTPKPNATLDTLRRRISGLQATVVKLTAANEETDIARKAKKAQIKQWMSDFEAREGRPPTNQDKEQVKDMFIEFKRLEAKAKSDGEALAGVQQELEAAQMEVQRSEKDAAPATARGAAPPPSVESNGVSTQSAAPIQSHELTADQLAETKALKDQLFGLQAEYEKFTCAATLLEQRLANAEERAMIAEELAKGQADVLKKVQQQIAAAPAPSSARPVSARLSSTMSSTTADLKAVADSFEAALAQGASLFKLNKKVEMFTLFKTTVDKGLKSIPSGQMKDRLKEALEMGIRQGLPTGPVTLRKAMDAFLLDARRSPVATPSTPPPGDTPVPTLRFGGMQETLNEADSQMAELQMKLEQLKSTKDTLSFTTTSNLSNQFAMTRNSVFSSDEASGDASVPLRAAQARINELERRLEEAQRQTSGDGMDGDDASQGSGGGGEEDGDRIDSPPLDTTTSTVASLSVTSPSATKPKSSTTAAGLASTTTINMAGVNPQLQLRLKNLEKKAKEDVMKIRKLEDQLAKAQSAAPTSGGGGGYGGGSATGGGGGDVSSKQMERELANQEKKLKKAFEEESKKKEREMANLTTQLKKATKDLEETNASIAALREERDNYKRQAADLGSMSQEVEQLRVRAAEATTLEATVKANEEKIGTLETQYREEQALRKKYWNMMEDMKGKIRVYARCRPMARYEIERGCAQVVRFMDDTTLEIESSRGTKQFIYDVIFPPDTAQEQVFADTKNLIQSCLDGFNVCIFAYGQTGSGKTFTMTGSPDLPGLSPRSITELFLLIRKMKNCEVSVSTYFVELYNENLQDLYYMLDNPKAKRDEMPDLDVKLDAKKMVFVKGAVIKQARNAEELLQLFNDGNAKRKVGGTKMNAESSRSHSVFSVLVEVFNKTTQKATAGKLSLVDLAGSERADKTGATDDRLKEAMSINKSLSALGDVISALSTNEKFIPYRNNKLTQLMQDSLGGNAKTLMFVNISPADYNQDETVTSLAYASRVKLITNNANKNQDSEEVAKLKAVIKALKAGQNPVELEMGMTGGGGGRVAEGP